MVRQAIQTVTGPIDADELGTTLMHEHLVVGFAGWEADTIRPGPRRAEMVAVCVDRIGQLKARGVRSLLDPCPNDLGRDVELSAEVAARTGFHIVCATGLYTERLGGSGYWHQRALFGPVVDAMAELFIRELTVGIGDTGIKAGVIKVASSAHEITDYERTVLRAAAKASNETGAPITTHTDRGTMGDVQQAELVRLGVPPHRIIIGHSCGTSDHAYHMRIVEGGSYVAFDRFGLNVLFPDDKRIESLVALLRNRKERQIVLSHDSVWCWRGEPVPAALAARLNDGIVFNPTHLHDHIIPRLLDAGVTRQQIHTMLVDNPRRFFTDEPPDAAAIAAAAAA
jgi:phosphotriesterase-related protein